MFPLTILLQEVGPNTYNGYLLLGYAVSFLIILGYVIYLINAQRNVREDLNLLQRVLDEDESSTEEQPSK